MPEPGSSYYGQYSIERAPSSHLYDADAIGSELYESFAPVVEMHGDPGNHLKILCYGMGRMLQPIDDLSKDGPNGEPGWSQVLDLNRAKTEWLPWLGQWVGYDVAQRGTNESIVDYDERERNRISTRSAHRRGSVPILREVVQEHLSGTKDVLIHERTTSAHQIHVFIYNSQIATSAAEAEKAARSQKAAGLIMTFTVLTGNDYTLLQASNATYNVLAGKHANYNSVLTNPGL